MQQDLLRFTTAGAVDDGKSTLIGRLLHDSGGIYEDELKTARRAAGDALELAFLTDGLRAEREQGITIDVAYRYFSTPRRKFIIADTPGHEQYTRNMVTGASTAQLAIIVLDARKGVMEQTKRHVFIAWLLGIERIGIVVNKMDLVGARQDVFESIQRDFEPLAAKLPGCRIDFLPVSALQGDNVVHSSSTMSWYRGPTLLEYLETLPLNFRGDSAAFRFPVQFVIRTENDFRAYAGQIASGSVKRGDEVIVLPSGRRTRVKSINTYDGDLDRALAPMSISLCLDDPNDVGRGDMLVHPDDAPSVTQRVQATLVWMAEVPLANGHPYLLKHTTKQVRAVVSEVKSKIDIGTLEEYPAEELRLNEIGIVTIQTHSPLFCDEYRINRRTGCFILIDPITNATVAAGMIRSLETHSSALSRLPLIHEGVTIWFTGLSSAGKTTLSRAVSERLLASGHKVEVLDGDDIRRRLWGDLGFSKEARDENIRRIAYIAELLTRNGVFVLVSAISPYRSVREEIRGRIGNFIEVYVNAPLAICEERDTKGLYRKARAGQISGFTGIDDPYEPPLMPEVECRTDRETLSESVDKVLRKLESWLK